MTPEEREARRKEYKREYMREYNRARKKFMRKHCPEVLRAQARACLERRKARMTPEELEAERLTRNAKARERYRERMANDPEYAERKRAQGRATYWRKKSAKEAQQ